jgi:hypothetical protein
MRYCGTVAKAGGNRENKLRPVVTEGSYLLESIGFRGNRYWVMGVNGHGERARLRAETLHSGVQARSHHFLCIGRVK